MVRIIEHEEIEHGFKVKIQTEEGQIEEFEMPEPEFDFLYYVQQLYDNSILSEEQAKQLTDKAMIMAHFHSQLSQTMLIEQMRQHAMQQAQNEQSGGMNQTESGLYVPDSGLKL